MPDSRPPESDEPHTSQGEDSDAPALACPECASRRFEEDERHGETVCANCGLVIEEGAIDPGPDWRAFDAEQRDKRSRAGPARTVMRHDLGLGSEIGYDNESSDTDAAQLGRMRRYHRQATYRPGADRNVVRALSEIERIASALGLPDSVAETAATTYRRAQTEGFLHGRSIEATAAACVYAAARFQRLPRQLDEVAEQAQADEEDIGRTYRRLSEKLELAVPITYPTDLLPSIASELELEPPVQERAIELIRATPEEDVVGKNPSSVAAAAVYRAGKQLDHRVTQSEVAEAAGVTEVTVRARLKDLADETGETGEPIAA